MGGARPAPPGPSQGAGTEGADAAAGGPLPEMARLGEDKETGMLLLDGKPMAHNHSKGVSCLACKLERKLRRQEKDGADAWLDEPEEILMGPDQFDQSHLPPRQRVRRTLRVIREPLGPPLGYDFAGRRGRTGGRKKLGSAGDAVTTGRFMTPSARLLRHFNPEACHVCGQEYSSEDNPVVLCDGCDVPVHVNCYGIVELPPGDEPWYCDACALPEVLRPNPKYPPCALCPSPGGALRLLTAKSLDYLPRKGLLHRGYRDSTPRFAHSTCVLAIPEAFCQPAARDPDLWLAETSLVSHDRFGLRCGLCKVPHGAPAQCSAKGCFNEMHALCARNAGYVCEFDPHGSLHIFCETHSMARYAATRQMALNVETAKQKKERYREQAENLMAQKRGEHDQMMAARQRWLLAEWGLFAPFWGRTPEKNAEKQAQLRQQVGCLGPPEEFPPLPAEGIQMPTAVRATLRPYQLAGVRWLVEKRDRGVGQILADEMGLGKTLQVITYLAYRREFRGDVGPHIVVAPLSVLPSWMNEFRRWAPTLKVVAFHGTQNERERLKTEKLKAGDFEVICTTYETILAERVWLHRTFFYSILVLDEGHRIKNEDALISKAVSQLRALGKLVLTGTPIQNNLKELWVLLNFLFPDALPSHTMDVFEDAFKQQDGLASISSGVVAAANELLARLMLRRVKADVLAGSLPPKIEEILPCPMAPMQEVIYRKLLEQDGVFGMLADTNGIGKQDAPSRHSVRFKAMNNLLLQLRKVCLHPALMEGEHRTEALNSIDELVGQSGKLQALETLLPKLKAEGHKVLFFSAFTSFLDTLQLYLTERDHRWLRLDGATSIARRRYETALFNKDDSKYFAYLISIRAGGLGLNLQGADTVIICEPQWNPSYELQAQDRCHRIGQTRPVTVYRMCCRGTCEENILTAAALKVQITEAVIESENSDNLKEMEAASRLSFQEMVSIVTKGAGSIGQGAGGAGAGGEEGPSHWKKFKGVEYTGKNDKNITDHWVDTTGERNTRKRKAVSVTVKTGLSNVGGMGRMQVSRASLEDEQRERQREQRSKERRARLRAESERRLDQHDSRCMECGQTSIPGLMATAWQPSLAAYNEKMMCRLCPRVIHQGCFIGLQPKAGWICAQHKCKKCLRNSSDAGGLIFRCVTCTSSFCDECLEDDFDPVEVHPAWEPMGFQLSSNYEYIRCKGCVAQKRPLPEPEERFLCRPCAPEDEAAEEAVEEEEEEEAKAKGGPPARRRSARARGARGGRKKFNLQDVAEEEDGEEGRGGRAGRTRSRPRRSSQGRVRYTEPDDDPDFDDDDFDDSGGEEDYEIVD